MTTDDGNKSVKVNDVEMQFKDETKPVSNHRLFFGQHKPPNRPLLKN